MVRLSFKHMPSELTVTLVAVPAKNFFTHLAKQYPGARSQSLLTIKAMMDWLKNDEANLRRLSHFPNDKAFDQCRAADPIQVPIDVVVDDILKERDEELGAERLEDLLTVLRRDKDGLKKMIPPSGEGLLSEDTAGSPLHRLVSKLADLAANSPVAEITELASKCLGELGPVELGSTVIRPERYVVSEGSSPFKSYLPHMVSRLLELALAASSSSETVIAAANGLKVQYSTFMIDL